MATGHTAVLSTMPPTSNQRPASRARTKEAKDGLIDLCTHATLQGNNISVRMLEFLTTFKHVPTGFRDLAFEFLDICRLLWSIEAGLLDLARRPDRERDFPADMEVELAANFRTLNTDFASLGHMLFRFLEYEKNGTFGRLQKGWRMMFADKEISRMRNSLKKSREALRMSALVFKWSAGAAKTDGAMAMGYAGLAAALERMRNGRPIVGKAAQVVAEAEAAAASGDETLAFAPDMNSLTLDPSPVVTPNDTLRELPQLPPIMSGESGTPLGHALSFPQRGSTPDLITRDDGIMMMHKRSIPEHSYPYNNGQHSLSRRSSRSDKQPPFAADRSMAHVHTPPSYRTPTATSNHTGGSHYTGGSHHTVGQHAASHHSGSLHRAQTASPTTVDTSCHSYDWRDSKQTENSYSSLRSKHEPDIPPGSPYPDSVTIHTHGALHAFHREPQQHRSQTTTLYHDPPSMLSEHSGSQNFHHHHHGTLHRHMPDDGDVLSDSALTEDDLFDKLEVSSNDTAPTQVIRLKPDPSTVPRWTPRNVTPGSHIALRGSLISAVRGQKHKTIQDLLDRGASPDTMPDACVLVESILNRDTESVRLLLLFGARPDVLDGEGITPLLTAVDEECPEAAKLLLKYGADPNFAAGPNSETPLALAVARCNLDFTQLLLTWGGDPDLVMSNGDTSFIRSMTKGAPRRLAEILLDYGADPNAKSAEGKTPLHDAIQARRVDLMKVLIDRGCDTNLPGPKHLLWPSSYHAPCLKLMLDSGADPKKCPGLMELAASLNNIDSIRLLIKAGVDPNVRKDGVYTALCTSIRDNRNDIFELLLASGADPNLNASEYPTFKAVRLHRLHMLPRLVAAGADLSSPKGLVEHCVCANHMDTLKWVLDQGVSPNDKTEKGHTALTTAIREARLEMIDMLLARGADPNIKGEDWPIHMAVKRPVILAKLLSVLHNPRAFRGVLERAVFHDQLDSVKQLLAAGVSVEDKNGGVFSPLTTALREEHKDMVYFLLRDPSHPLGGGGADPNEPGEHLPLVKALRRSRGPDDTEMIEHLLTKGADINRMYRGWNAVMQAVENGDIKVLQIVLEGAARGGQVVDLNIKDDAGRTVLEIAEGRSWNEAVDMLIAASRR
jgi:ankyrin repeat protein